MKRTFPFKLKVALVAGGLVAVLAGGAIAADRLSPKQERDAIVADAAKQLGVDASKLDAALNKAMENRVDAAVAAGQITKAQGAELKKWIAAGGIPLLGGGLRDADDGPGGAHGFGGGGFGGGDVDHGGGYYRVGISAAAKYLGVTEAALRSSLQQGSSLADVARSKGKTVDGLEAAVVAAVKAELEKAAADGRLTQAQKTAILADLPARVADVVERAPGFRDDDGFGGPGDDDGFGQGGQPSQGFPD